MLLTGDYIDGTGASTAISKSVSLARMLKHAAIAGYGGNVGRIGCFVKSFGLLAYYSEYFDIRYGFVLQGFKNPKTINPTQKSHFSVIASTAIADILSKDILLVKHTHTYEDAMSAAGIPIKGSRPDLYCASMTKKYAIEVKGDSKLSISGGFEASAKARACNPANPLIVNAGFASILYGIYKSPKFRFIDPTISDDRFDGEFHKRLAIRYYNAVLSELLNSSKSSMLTLDGRVFVIREIKFDEIVCRLMVDEAIKDAIDSSSNILINGFPSIDTEDVFVDVDGIGVSIVR